MSQTEETTSTSPAVPLEGKDLKEAVRTQLEYYFSPQNLANDAFLLSKMNDEHYVPLSLIASFERVKSLTTDLSLIVESLEDSDQVEASADGQMIRPKEAPKRAKLILRDLPAETTEQELKDLFSQVNMTPSIQSAVNDCWFVSFESEEAASTAFDFLKNQTLHDKPIRARFKSEPIRREVRGVPLFVPSSVPYNAGLLYSQQMEWNPLTGVPPYYGDMDMHGEGGRGRGPKKGRKDNTRRGAEHGRKRAGGRKAKNQREKKQPAVQLRASDFPPLPNATASEGNRSRAVKHYDRATLTDALSHLQAHRPDSLRPEFPVVSAGES